MLVTRCPKCSQRWQIPDSKIGQEVRCKKPGCAGRWVIAGDTNTVSNAPELSVASLNTEKAAIVIPNFASLRPTTLLNGESESDDAEPTADAEEVQNSELPLRRIRLPRTHEELRTDRLAYLSRVLLYTGAIEVLVLLFAFNVAVKVPSIDGMRSASSPEYVVNTGLLAMRAIGLSVAAVQLVLGTIVFLASGEKPSHAEFVGVCVVIVLLFTSILAATGFSWIQSI